MEELQNLGMAQVGLKQQIFQVYQVIIKVVVQEQIALPLYFLEDHLYLLTYLMSGMVLHGLQHLHKTLCLAREIHSVPPISNVLQNTENKYDSVTLSQQLIEIHRKGWTQEEFPFVMEQKGLTLVLPTYRKSIPAEAQESLEA